MSLLIYIGFIGLQVLWHWYLIVKKNVVPNHAFHAVLRFAVAILLMYYSDTFSIVNLFTYGVTFWFLFDSLLNWARGESVIHLGDHFLDQLQKNTIGEYPAFIMKAIAFVALIAAYYLN